MITKTFYGPWHRAQFLILDLSPDRISFAVSVIPSSYDKFTAFRGKAGTQVYFGQDVDAAWDALKRYCPHAEWPRKWNRFLKPEGKPLIEIL